MIVAKRFHWEAAHRLPWHEGLCRNNHGHSYRMEAVVEGAVDARGMVIDFQEIKAALKPLIDAWDHATLVAAHDHEYLAVARELRWKHYVLPFDTTAENLARHAADVLCREAAPALRVTGASGVRIRVYETESCYAEYARPVIGEEASAPAGEIAAVERA
jgi:6-pyruvoyltetrahydropterin/6-carboxytetrahydropterin synthase